MGWRLYWGWPLPASGDCFGIQTADRQYAVFAPDGSKFTNNGTSISVEFAGASQFLVVCPLPSVKDMPTFHKYGYAIPRDTQMSWKVDADKGTVTTTWKITTDCLKGTEHQVIQGWIPHHYNNTTTDIKFTSLDFISPRGKLRCAPGNTFNITYPFNGISPNLPAPKKLGGDHDYDPARMHTYLADVAKNPKFGNDTYWGGKDILRFGQCALMAQQMDDPLYKNFVDGLHGAMANWYTYTPGEKDHFFMAYPKWKAMVGSATSYGSEGFNDHHFHYGYFTFATALLIQHDPAFAADFGEMATLVAKDYANWDRTDKRYPLFRTFDIWQGHSWAGGTSSPGGENQESSSEGVQSWAGLTYLGQALNNNAMRDAGVMGYAMESAATMEYWFNVSGEVFPSEWKHPVTGMVWSGGKVYGTYFTGDPAWVYAIQWLPASPMLSYLVRDPAFAKKSYENMCADYTAKEKKTPGTKSFGAALGSVMLGYRLMYEPDAVAAELDTLYNEPGDKIAHDANEMTVMYYQAHSMRNLGLVDWSCHGSSATSMVYKNDKGVRTFIVWNPTTKEQTVTFYETDKPIGLLTAPAQKLTSSTKLK